MGDPLTYPTVKSFGCPEVISTLAFCFHCQHSAANSPRSYATHPKLQSNSGQSRCNNLHIISQESPSLEQYSTNGNQYSTTLQESTRYFELFINPKESQLKSPPPRLPTEGSAPHHTPKTCCSLANSELPTSTATWPEPKSPQNKRWRAILKHMWSQMPVKAKFPFPYETPISLKITEEKRHGLDMASLLTVAKIY